RDCDAIALRHERIGQVHAPVTLVRVSEREVMVAVALVRQRRDGVQLNRSLSAPKVVEAWEGGSDRLPMKNRAAVELEYDRVEHPTNVGALLSFRQHSVAIAVEIRDR